MKRGLTRVEKYREIILNGPIGRTLLWLGLPLTVVQVVNTSYNIADTYWLSRYSGIAYAAPRQVWPFFMFIGAVMQGASAASTALISQAIGAENYEYARKATSHFIAAMLLMGTSASVAFLLLGPPVYKHLIATPPEVYEYTVSYSNVISLDLLLSGFYLGYSTVLQAVGDTRTPSVAGAVSALVNIVLDPLLILGVGYGNVMIIPRMGVVGAAWATVVSRFIGVLAIFRTVLKKYPFLKVKPSFKVEKEWLIKSARIGAPVALMMAGNSMAFMLQNRLINAFGAYVALAAAIGFILMDIADATLLGFTMPVATMVGQAIGAQLEYRARSVAKKAMLYIGTGVFTGSMVVLAFRRVFIELFTNVPEILGEVDVFVQYFSPTLAFFAIFFTGMSTGRGSGHTLYPTVVGIVRLWVFRILLGYALAFTFSMGTRGLWLSMSLSNLLAGLAVIPWVLWGNWTKPVLRTCVD